MSISIALLVESFREILGWPYKLGGTNQNGIDCSGAFVRGYRQQGQSIYHGSNRIIRAYCEDAFTIESASDLKIGMAIYKQRTDLSRMKAEYKPGGRYYNPALPNDYYHIGLVTSVNPLRIINATTPVAREETRLSNWTVAAYLIAANYSEQPTQEKTAIVTARTGSTVNLRRSASLSAPILTRVPLGQAVTITGDTGQWSQVRYQSYNGYMMTEFLSEGSEGDENEVCDLGELIALRKRVEELEAMIADEQG